MVPGMVTVLGLGAAGAGKPVGAAAVETISDALPIVVSLVPLHEREGPGLRVAHLGEQHHISQGGGVGDEGDEAVDAEAEARLLAVTVDSNTVTLHGTVDSWSERAAASSAAWSAPGVAKVVNEIKVQP